MQNNLEAIVSSEFNSYYRQIAAKLHDWVKPLSSDEIWQRPYPYGNSIGHLLLHLTGNLSYYIGARIANTGYTRNRDLEFTDPNPRPKEELLRNFDAAIEMVIATINKQKAADWSAPYSAERTDAKDRFMIVLNCAGHLYHHVGQSSICRKKLPGRSRHRFWPELKNRLPSNACYRRAHLHLPESMLSMRHSVSSPHH